MIMGDYIYWLLQWMKSLLSEYHKLSLLILFVLMHFWNKKTFTFIFKVMKETEYFKVQNQSFDEICENSKECWSWMMRMWWVLSLTSFDWPAEPTQKRAVANCVTDDPCPIPNPLSPAGPLHGHLFSIPIFKIRPHVFPGICLQVKKTIGEWWHSVCDHKRSEK